ncbi:MAG: hypothetical protein ACRD3Y_07220 [Bryobacteraceae bacterium]
MLTAERASAAVTLPSVVLCEVWKAMPRHGSMRLRGFVNSVVSLDADLASAVGALLDRTGSREIADATVALVAYATRPSLVLTSDPEDIEAFVRLCGATCARFPKTADVVLQPL